MPKRLALGTFPGVTCIVADPAWTFDDKLGKKGAEAQYQCMSIDDIAAMNPMPADVSPNSVLFLWRVSAMQEEALRVARAWGYVPKSELVWDKLARRSKPKKGKEEQPPKPHFGLGRYVRQAHETCLIAVRGRAPVAIKSVRSRFEAHVREHSRKPEEFYQIVEALYPSAMKFELFARERRPGWVQQHGNQLGALG